MDMSVPGHSWHRQNLQPFPPCHGERLCEGQELHWPGETGTAAVSWDSSHDLGQASSAPFLHSPFGFFCRWQQERTGSP